jgi:hypothetical protein
VSLIDALPLLPRPIARHTLFILTEALPPPLGDLPEERAARDESAIAAVVALRPEARLAARSVAADAWAMDCLHLAGERIRQDPDMARRCHREAAHMMRAADSALRSLRIMQSARAKADTIPTLGESPEPAHAEAEPQSRSAAPVRSEHAAVVAEPPRSDLAAEADAYALQHRKRASLIRRLRRLPSHIDCGPIRPALVHAIITGTTPILRSLDSPDSSKHRLPASPTAAPMALSA